MQINTILQYYGYMAYLFLYQLAADESPAHGSLQSGTSTTTALPPLVHISFSCSSTSIRSKNSSIPTSDPRAGS